MGLYDTFVEEFAKSRIGGWLFVHVVTHLDRRLIKASRGKLSSGVGSRLHRSALVLSTTGAKSGKPRDVPLLYARDGENYIVIASATGQKRNPAWYYNLKAHPEATVHAEGKTVPVMAREAAGGERDRLFRVAVDLYSGFDTYRARTARTIPVMVLEPRK